MKIRIFCLIAVLTTLFGSPLWARSDNLYDFVSRKNKVLVKLDQFSVSDKNGEIKGAELTNIFKETLRNRKSVNFNIVEDLEGADLVISGEIKNFTYSEKDPIDILIPVGLVIDLVMNQSYARLEFNIKVYNPRKNKLVWKKHLKATLTESRMSRQESIALIMKRAARVFIKECFGKPRN